LFSVHKAVSTTEGIELKRLRRQVSFDRLLTRTACQLRRAVSAGVSFGDAAYGHFGPGRRGSLENTNGGRRLIPDIARIPEGEDIDISLLEHVSPIE
jgi:hypothetical protein